MPSTPVPSRTYIANLKITFLSNPDMYRKVEYSALQQIKTSPIVTTSFPDSSWVVTTFFHNAIEH
jgi:hypothetical protein